MIDPFLDLFPPLQSQQEIVEQLLELLGPLDADGRGPFGLARGREREEGDQFASDAVKAFAERGFMSTLVPVVDGGRSVGPLEDQVVGLIASRDLSLGIALGVIGLAILPVRLAGTKEQRARVFGSILSGSLVGIGISEWDHGSDVGNIDTRATRVRLDDSGAPIPCADDGFTHYLLEGDKTLINNGTQAEIRFVLARTAEGPEIMKIAGLSFFMLRPELAGVVPLPRHLTSGVRAADISGFRLERALVPKEDRIGAEGDGFRILRRTVEISRGGIASLAAGQALQAFRWACRHARERQLYGAPILELEPVRDALVAAYVELELIFALAIKSVYVLQFAPVSSKDLTCQAKLFGPLAASSIVAELGLVLGARSYLRAHPYERLVRDSRLLPIFDGTAHIQEAEVLMGAARPAPPNVSARALIDSIHAYRTALDPEVDLYRGDRPSWPRSTATELAALDASFPELGLRPLVVARTVVERIAVHHRSDLEGERSRTARLISEIGAAAALAERILFEGESSPAARRAALRIAAAKCGAAALSLAQTFDPEGARSILLAPESAEVARGIAAVQQSDSRRTVLSHVAAFDL